MKQINKFIFFFLFFLYKKYIIIFIIYNPYPLPYLKGDKGKEEKGSGGTRGKIMLFI